MHHTLKGSQGGRTRRAFIAVEPPLEVRSAMAGLQPEGRWIKRVPIGQMHITMAFLGNLTDEEMGRARAALLRTRQKSFRVVLEGIVAGLGNIPSGNHCVVSAMVSEGGAELSRLHDEIALNLRSESIYLERRRFAPHVTIARVKNLRESSDYLKQFMEKHANTKFGSFTCDSVKLESSLLTQEGPIYSDVEVLKLE